MEQTKMQTILACHHVIVAASRISDLLADAGCDDRNGIDSMNQMISHSVLLTAAAELYAETVKGSDGITMLRTAIDETKKDIAQNNITIKTVIDAMIAGGLNEQEAVTATLSGLLDASKK